MARGNPDKLKPVRSKQEASERGQKGGKASGEARRERKQLKDMLLLILEGATEGRTKSEEICTSLVNEALSGNVKAFEVIRDTIGEKPTDKLDVDVKDNAAQVELREYLQELKKG